MKMEKNCGTCVFHQNGECYYWRETVEETNLCDMHSALPADGNREKMVVELAESLQGTCSMGVSLPDLTEQEWDLFDEIVFECEMCGWWCEGGDRNSHENAGGDICGQCYEELCWDEEDD